MDAEKLTKKHRSGLTMRSLTKRHMCGSISLGGPFQSPQSIAKAQPPESRDTGIWTPLSSGVPGLPLESRSIKSMVSVEWQG